MNVRSLAAACLLPLMTACIVVPVPVISSGNATPKQPLPASTPAYQSFDRQLNAFRAENGQGALTSNAGLDAVAASHAAYLAKADLLTHRGADGRRATQRVRRAGISRCGAGENLAQGYTTPQGAFSGWLASPDHRANMLSAGYANYGIGRADDVWVLVMLLPC